MELKGSNTEKNLLAAFAGESQVRNRYGFFAEVARKEGHERIARTFELTADQEREHARRLFGFLEGGWLEVSGSFPAGVVGSTLENLKASASSENYEHSKLYPEFAEAAHAEGFERIAQLFDAIALVEMQHEWRFKELATDLERGTLYKKEHAVSWRCFKCGYVHQSENPPEVCPVCDDAGEYYEIGAD